MKNLKTLLLTGTALFTLAACGNNADDKVDEAEDKVEETVQDDAKEDENEKVDIKEMHNTEFVVALEDAVDIFIEEFGENVEIEEIEFELEDGVYIYDVSGWEDDKEYQAVIDAQTGDILEKETDDNDDRNNVIVIPDVISPQEAMKSALDYSKGDYVESWKLSLDDDHGRMIYEVDVNDADDDIVVNAITGEVIGED